MATNQKHHIRRCHVCGTVNEHSEGAVERCSHCRKHLAPFYYFDESELQGVRDNQLEMSLWNHQGRYHPIWGIAAVWEEDALEGNTG